MTSKDVVFPAFELLPELDQPADLSGQNGTNRAVTSPRQIAANNDIDAVRAWLAEFHDSPQTLRAYKKESERLLLWAIHERGKALSSLTREDLIGYEDFLKDPRPRGRWCGPRRPRHSRDWRPFQGPLKASSRRQALVILNALFSYLTEAGYLAGNPLALVRRRKRRGKAGRWKGPDRHLDRDAWSFALRELERLPEETARDQAEKERLRFLLATLYLLGPRVSEVADHTMGSFVQRRGKWWWDALGKGQKEGRVPVNDDMLVALRRYRTFLGLPPLPPPGDTTPLILSLKGTRGISSNMVYRLVRKFFQHLAHRAEKEHPDWSDLFRRVSTHWLRHTSLTHQADTGLELRFIQRNARHANLTTTGLYVHADDGAWHDAMQGLRLDPSKGVSDPE